MYCGASHGSRSSASGCLAELARAWAVSQAPRLCKTTARRRPSPVRSSLAWRDEPVTSVAIHNPWDGSVVGEVPLSGPAELEAAIGRAVAAFEVLRALPRHARADILSRAAAEALAAAKTRAAAKTQAAPRDGEDD